VAVNEKMGRGRKNKGKRMSNRKSRNKREEELKIFRYLIECW